MSDHRWRDLSVRVASAAVLAPLGLAAIWFGGAFWVACMGVIVAGLGFEWAALCGAGARRGQRLVVPLVLLAAGAAFQLGYPVLSLGVLAVGAVALLAACGRLLLPAGLVYIGVAALALLALRAGPNGLHRVLFMMVVVWAADIGAYLCGRLLAGPRLAPRISPGKTWSGAAGGTLCAVLAGLALEPGRPGQAIVLALILSVVAQAGDLLESAVKRHVGAKDSGWIIPGHGGLLDRLDGVLAAAPTAFLWAWISGPADVPWH